MAAIRDLIKILNKYGLDREITVDVTEDIDPETQNIIVKWSMELSGYDEYID